MAFIDEIQFHAKAGRGGDGVVRWRHERGKEFSGAAGGNGGKGGDIYVRAVRDINILARHKVVKEFKSRSGDEGQNWSRQGASGEDFYIELPIGSVIRNLQTDRVVELVEDGQVSKLLHGGRGGVGNEHFKASTNVTPMQSTPGMPGEEADFVVELNLIADAGLIGLPNAGKSSLLNALTRANAKVASYAFTTLDPNLGALAGGYVLADIPGLIEGASEGKGLGHKFLKHVKRTKILLHLVSLENKALIGTYKTVRKELEKYGHGLTDKKEILILSKTDTVTGTPKEVAKKIKDAKTALKKYNKNILEVSILDDASLKKLADQIVVLIRQQQEEDAKTAE
ncbi:MAG: GTPase ObgE [Candidatus Pacebacteria bacterium]|nr:GTPase ObgE [Candidatus Paceibacterota bacterium]